MKGTRFFWLALMLVCGSASAQQWPTRPVRIIVPFPPGQASDIIARTVADRLSTAVGQQFFVDNRAGAGSVVGSELAAKAAPDGYTFLAAGPSAVTSSEEVLLASTHCSLTISDSWA